MSNDLLYEIMYRLCILLLALVGAIWCVPSPLKSTEQVEEYRKFLQQTRQGNNTFLVSSSAIAPGGYWENSGKFEGDIILDDWQIDALVTDYAAGRSAYIWPNTKWPGNVVVYEIAAGHFNQAQIDHIIRSIQWIEHFSCIRFRLRNANDRNYVRLTGYNNGCYASVGFWHDRGIHTLNLTPNVPDRGCFVMTTIIHEWLHVLGFFHMQSTYNRYDYVRIAWENIQRGMEHNFERYATNIVSNLGLPYEYTSCMHYFATAFSINGRPTIIPLRAHYGVMGQQTYVTHYDWLRLRRHYNCPGGWSAEEAKLLEAEVEKSIPLMAPKADDEIIADIPEVVEKQE
ncbi:seminal metalloprotease 1-like [Leptidea sinapis]|uniref:seminal metalloprotease 1-like n=1 Tax=Leptidea sinapis TaxID=189913 RepID=UPI002140D393|nr:seminal metalloprotease 1-like [Leptidea sinapis]